VKAGPFPGTDMAGPELICPANVEAGLRVRLFLPDKIGRSPEYAGTQVCRAGHS